MLKNKAFFTIQARMKLHAARVGHAVVDPEIHSTRGVNKIIKYNDKIFFFSLYIIFLL